MIKIEIILEGLSYAFLCIFYLTVRYPEDGQKSERNMSM